MFTLVAVIIFALVALMHIFRLIREIDVQLDGSYVPMWVSYFGALVSIGMVCWGMSILSISK